MAVEVEVPGKEPEIREVLHPAVALAQDDHGLELLGDDALPRVAVQLGGRKVEKSGIRDLAGARNDHISESDIDMQ